MLAVHEEAGLTGCFRIRGNKIHAEVRFVVRKYGVIVEHYTTWRAANEDDLFLAWFLARHANDNEEDNAKRLAAN